MDEGMGAVRLKHAASLFADLRETVAYTYIYTYIVHARGLANKNRALLFVCPDCVEVPNTQLFLISTETPKVCNIMALMTIIKGSGLLFYILLRFR